MLACIPTKAALENSLRQALRCMLQSKAYDKKMLAHTDRRSDPCGSLRARSSSHAFTGEVYDTHFLMLTKILVRHRLVLTLSRLSLSKPMHTNTFACTSFCSQYDGHSQHTHAHKPMQTSCIKVEKSCIQNMTFQI
jgi:hypothetical protein